MSRAAMRNCAACIATLAGRRAHDSAKRVVSTATWHARQQHLHISTFAVTQASCHPHAYAGLHAPHKPAATPTLEQVAWASFTAWAHFVAFNTRLCCIPMSPHAGRGTQAHL